MSLLQGVLRAFHLPGRHDQKKHGRHGPGADGAWDYGRVMEAEDVFAQVWLDPAGRFRHVAVEHYWDAEKALRAMGKWNPAGRHMTDFLHATGAVRVHLFSGGSYSLPSIDVEFARRPNMDQVLSLMALKAANPAHEVVWEHKPLLGRKEYGRGMESFLDHIDTLDFSEEPASFHLPGRHDQKKHGRRGPGAPVFTYTGDVDLRRTVRASQAEEAMFGRLLSEDQWQRLTGSPDGARIDLGSTLNYPSPAYSSISASVGHRADPYGYLQLTVTKSGGDSFIHVDAMNMQRQRAQAFSLQGARMMFKEAQALGMSRVETYGAGVRHSSNTGYYTWAKLGFDRVIPFGLHGLTPHGESRTSQLMATPEGRAFWKARGSGGFMKFDLTPGSESWRQLDSFLASSRLARSLEAAEEPSSFHLAGRHDQKLHGRHGPGMADAKTAELFNRWRYTIHRKGTDEEFAQAEQAMFGKRLADSDYRELFAVPDFSSATLTPSRGILGMHMMAEVKDGNIEGFRGMGIRYRLYNNDGQRSMHVTNFYLYPGYRGQGAGPRMMAVALNKAHSLGLDSVTLEAGRTRVQTGYYVWPRMGFDGPLPRGMRIPKELGSPTRLSDLMLTPEGRAFWRQKGRNVDVAFDLSPNSRSWQVFRSWQQERDVDPTGLSEDPVSFHLPGRHDQKLHGRRGVGASVMELPWSDLGQRGDHSPEELGVRNLGAWLAPTGALRALERIHSEDAYDWLSAHHPRFDAEAVEDFDAIVELMSRTTGAIRVQADGLGRLKGWGVAVYTAPTTAQRRTLGAIHRAKPEWDFTWEVDGLTGYKYGTQWGDFLRALDSVILPQPMGFSDPYAFHLPGRHDQKLHGRRGPGAASPYPDIDLGREITLREAMDQPQGSVWLKPGGSFHGAGGLHSLSATRALRRRGITVSPGERSILRIQQDHGVIRLQIRARHDSVLGRGALAVGADTATRPTSRQMDVLEVLSGRASDGFYFDIVGSPREGSQSLRPRLASGSGFSAFRTEVDRVFGPEEHSEPSSFHLPGRHDQKLHGRRGPGYDTRALTFTGSARLSFTGPSGRGQTEHYYFGRKLTDLEWQRLAGCPDGGEATFNMQGYRTFVRTQYQGVDDAAFNLVYRGPRDLEITSVNLFMDKVHRGAGFRGALTMLRQARDLGIKSVEATAIGEWGDEFTGYYTWPKLGFDGHIGLRPNAPPLPWGLSHATSVLDLYQSREGRTFWKRWGRSVHMSFDLTPGSRSWQVLDAYASRPGWDALISSSEALSFHLPGRHDQKKHGRRGAGAYRFGYTGRVDVERGSAEREERIRSVEEGLFGRVLSKEEWQRLSGTPDGGTVSLWNEGGALLVNMMHPDIRGYPHFTVEPDYSGHAGPRMNSFSVFMDRKRPIGASVQAIKMMFKEAQALGITTAGTAAVGSRHDRNTGYYTWPKLGFDGPIPWNLVDHAPHGATTLLQLMASPEGRTWWKRHGTNVYVHFDLAPNSASWRQLDSYLASSRFYHSIEATEALLFHLAGRHDQKKHGRRGVGYRQLSFTGDVFVRREGHGDVPSEQMLLGGSLTREQWARLSGAPDGSSIFVNNRGWNGSPRLSVTVGSPEIRSANFDLHWDHAGRTVMDHVMLYGHPGRAQAGGAAFQGAIRTIKGAAEFGVSRILIDASGGGRDTGYWTWPKLGFDGPLNSYLRDALSTRPNLSSAQTVQDLMASPEGRAWWKGRHSSLPMEFDLTPGSRSWQILDGFLLNSRAAGLLSSSEPSSFHLSGRHDQKTHGRRGPGGRVGNMLGRAIREEPYRSGVDGIGQAHPWQIPGLGRAGGTKAALSAIQAHRGWGPSPRKVGPEAMEGLREFYLADPRGVSRAALATGDAPDRQSFYATGLYAITGGPGRAEAHARALGLTDGGSPVRVVMSPGHRSATLAELRPRMAADAQVEAAALGSRSGPAREAYRLVFSDTGLYAAWKGYDVLEGASLGGVREAYILNRGRALMEAE